MANEKFLRLNSFNFHKVNNYFLKYLNYLLNKKSSLTLIKYQGNTALAYKTFRRGNSKWLHM